MLENFDKLFVFPQPIYNTILVFLGFFIVLIPYKGKMHDGRPGAKGWFFGFTRKGKWLLILVLMAGIVTVLKDYNKDIDSEQIQHYHDSIARDRQDTSNAVLTRTFHESLAKYGLKYDSVSNVVSKRIDKINTKVTVINKSEPEISVCAMEQDSIANKKFFGRVVICVGQANATDVKINAEPILSFGNALVVQKKHLVIMRGENFTVGTHTTTYNAQPGDLITRIYLRLYGSFSDSNKKNKRKFNDVVVYDLKSKTWGHITDTILQKKVMAEFTNRSSL